MTTTATDRDQALHEAAAALAAATNILQFENPAEHLIAQVRHLLTLAQQGVSRALFADWPEP